MSDLIKVFCADDSPDIVLMLETYIDSQHDMETVGSCSDGNALGEQIQNAVPDVVVVDLTMPGVDVVKLIAQLRQDHPDIRTIVFSGHNDPEAVDACIDAGAWGFIVKQHELDHIVEAIRNVAAGKLALMH